jgi:hypothetical protein
VWRCGRRRARRRTRGARALSFTDCINCLVPARSQFQSAAGLLSFVNSCAACVGIPLSQIESYFGIGGSSVACTTTHSSKVQGAGLCCAAVSSGALSPPPPGTTLAPYTPGSAATFSHTVVTDSGGHCGTCMIVGSKSRKNPGKPVLRYIRGGPACPSSRTGCCALGA